jgi:hypothetical protein
MYGLSNPELFFYSGICVMFALGFIGGRLRELLARVALSRGLCRVSLRDGSGLLMFSTTWTSYDVADCCVCVGDWLLLAHKQRIFRPETSLS